MNAIPVPPLPDQGAPHRLWPDCHSSARALTIASAARLHQSPWVVQVNDARSLDQLRRELGFFAGDSLPVLQLPDWEVLPYDQFSPLPKLLRLREKRFARP